jgi:hypothetical protein
VLAFAGGEVCREEEVEERLAIGGAKQAKAVPQPARAGGNAEAKGLGDDVVDAFTAASDVVAGSVVIPARAARIAAARLLDRSRVKARRASKEANLEQATLPVKNPAIKIGLAHRVHAGTHVVGWETTRTKREVGEANGIIHLVGILQHPVIFALATQVAAVAANCGQLRLVLDFNAALSHSQGRVASIPLLKTQRV